MSYRPAASMPNDPQNQRPGPPQYKVYRSHRRPLMGVFERLRRVRPSRPERERKRDPSARRASWKRILGWSAVAVGAWLGLSLILFFVSAHQSSTRVPGTAKEALSDGGHILIGSSTILVLGSDRRPEGTKEPGANQGPARADTILLYRLAGSKSAKLSIPRDTLVTVPGQGVNKINAAFAFGGAALTIKTIEFNFPPIEIDHLVIVNFEGFPKFVDALGGVDMKTGCIVSTFSGKTIRLRAGDHHLSGDQALQVVRTRKNRCNVNENDLTRARRQQQFLDAVKSQIKSPLTFFRLPWVAWNGPKAIDSDLGGFGMLSLFLEMQRASTSKPAVMPVVPVAGTSNLQVVKPRAQQAVQRFLDP